MYTLMSFIHVIGLKNNLFVALLLQAQVGLLLNIDHTYIYMYTGTTCTSTGTSIGNLVLL
jgi:hypothetical protein